MAAGGTRRLSTLQASLNTRHSEYHLIAIDTNPDSGSGDYCGTEPRTAKLAYLSAAVDRLRLITADVHIVVHGLCR